ncbi:MAG: hypothetical protein WD795_00595 [Woeseia sp.]
MDSKDDSTTPAESRSFLIEDSRRDTAENCQSILSLLRYVDDEISAEAEVGRDLLMREAIAVIGYLGQVKVEKLNETDEARVLREQIADSILDRARRHGFTVTTSDGEFPFQLVGPKVTVEGLAEQVAELHGAVPPRPDRPQTTHEMIRDLCRGIRRSAKQADKAIADDDLSVRMVSVGKATEVIEHLICNLVDPQTTTATANPEALAILERFERACSQKTAKACADRLRAFNWDASENIGVPDDAPLEDRFTVTRTWTLKGLRDHLAREMFLESLLPDESAGGAA